jgi:hypothetical protein
MEGYDYDIVVTLTNCEPDTLTFLVDKSLVTREVYEALASRMSSIFYDEWDDDSTVCSWWQRIGMQAKHITKPTVLNGPVVPITIVQM